MFVVFEGIDGSGKTTISNRAARALRESGLTVTHARENGTLASPVAQSIRAFGRDERQLGLTPYAELLVYLAREAQLFDEVTGPALALADVVIADRFFYSAEVLACAGRGLPIELVHPLVEMAARQIVPDLVILIDVDPQIARARRRIAKILKDEDNVSPSRKGLAGASLSHRLRDGYRALAAGDPRRWVVVDNSDGGLQAIVDVVVQAVQRAGLRAGLRGGTAPASIDSARPRRQRKMTPSRSLGHDGALPALLDWVDRRQQNEPVLAAYMLSGLSGAGIDERRFALAAPAPQVTASGLQGMSDPMSWRLRWHLIDRAPHQVARSLGAPTPDGDQKDRLRRTLNRTAPAHMLLSLRGDGSQAAFAYRDDLYPALPDAVMSSLAMLGSGDAWRIRERWLAAGGGLASLAQGNRARVACLSLTGLDDERSWQLRTAARAAAPIAALASLTGVSSDRAWRWRTDTLPVAPKTVLGTLRGLDDPRAWTMRETTASRCKEAIESFCGQDGPRAWNLRNTYADLWPGAVAQSLGGLGETSRGVAMVARLLTRHSGDISLLRHAVGIQRDRLAPHDEHARAAEPARRERSAQESAPAVLPLLVSC